MAEGIKITVGAFEYVNLTIGQVVKKIKSMGASYAEIGMGKNVTDQNLDEAKDLFHRESINVTAVVALAKLNTALASGELKEHQQIILQQIKFAKELNAPFIVTYFGGNPNLDVEEAIKRYKENIGPCLEDAAKKNVVILVENHFSPVAGDATASVDSCKELLETINSEYFALNYDPCNLYIAGEEGFPYGYTVLQEYIRSIHLKDAIRYVEQIHGPYEGRILVDHKQGNYRCVPLGEGAMNTDGLLSKLVLDGYKGSICIEPHTIPLDEAFHIAIDYCRARL